MRTNLVFLTIMVIALSFFSNEKINAQSYTKLEFKKLRFSANDVLTVKYVIDSLHKEPSYHNQKFEYGHTELRFKGNLVASFVWEVPPMSPPQPVKRDIFFAKNGNTYICVGDYATKEIYIINDEKLVISVFKNDSIIYFAGAQILEAWINKNSQKIDVKFNPNLGWRTQSLACNEVETIFKY